MEDTQRVDQSDQIAEARGSAMICSDHAERARESFGWRIFSEAKNTQQRGRETHREGSAEAREGDAEPGRAHTGPTQSSTEPSRRSPRFTARLTL